MPNMQVLCPCYVRCHIKVMLHWQMCRCLLKFELNESINKWSIKHLFHFFFAINQILVIK